MTAQDRQWMAMAIMLAKRGQYSASPNPCVGCVITDGEKIAEGWHQVAGQGHAEVNAINDAKAKAMVLENCTLYVTLEPCSHQGRTPPCCDAIIAEGFRRVVYGMEDPNPQVSGTGITRLKDAGITVDGPLMVDEAKIINAGFIKRMQINRPKVIAKMASSLDGRTAMASGESFWITGPDARADVQRLRARSCAIVTGIDTVIVDDPSMTVRDESLAAPGAKVRQPLRVIVDSQLRMPLDAKILQNPEEVIVVHACEDNARVSALTNKGVDVVKLASAKGKVDLNALLDLLAKRHCNQVMIEAGSRLFGAFLQAQFIDEVFCYMAPTFLGSAAKPLADIPLDKMNQQIRFSVKNIRSVGQDYRWQLVPEYLTNNPQDC